MPKMGKQAITLLIVVVCIGLIFGVKLLKQSFLAKGQSGDLAKIKGPENAPIKIIEYVDFQCPACAQGAKYIKGFMVANLGKVQIELKHFPLPMHQHSLLASRYAECASRQGKFWEFQDLVFELQGQWKGLANATPTFENISQEIGLDMAQVNKCLQDKKVDQVIEQNKGEGTQRGVQSTPSYFINGKIVVGQQSLAAELNRLIAGQGSADEISQSKDPRLKASYVCMKDNKYIGMEQVPVEINGKIYYGCCAGCAAKFQSDEALRHAADPLTGEDVDKADAYIILKPDGSDGVLYFKSAETYSKYVEKNKTE